MPGIFLKERTVSYIKSPETICEKVYAKRLLTSGLIITIEKHSLWTNDITGTTLS